MKQIGDAELMSRFISMGHNCEFGSMQSVCNVNALDLLRWAGTNIDVVLRLLEDKFRHISDPTKLSIRLYEGEYFVANSYYGFEWHSFVKEGQMSSEQLLKRELIRLKRQAEMLLDDLEEGHRILLREALDGAEFDRLDEFVRLVRGYGSSTILFVTTDEQKAGTVERVSNVLVFGYIANTDNMSVQDQLPHWLPMCREAYALIQGGR